MRKPFRQPWLWILLAVPFVARVLTWESPESAPLDPAAVSAGEQLFSHEWTARDPLAGSGDGIGPVFNATSCIACHRQGAPGGGGPNEHNVTTFRVLEVRRERKNSELVTVALGSRNGVVHSSAVSDEFLETLTNVDSRLSEDSRSTPSPSFMPGCRPPAPPLGPTTEFDVSQRNTPALFGSKLIDEIPDRVIIANERGAQLKHGLNNHNQEDLPIGRALRLADGRVGRFGWKAQIGTLQEFVQTACANELGLGNPGHEQPAPLARPDDKAPALDLTLEQCEQMTAFINSLPQPIEQSQQDTTAQSVVDMGRSAFLKVGCADCHVPDLGSVRGIYSDLLLHRMGRALVGGGSYGEPPITAPDFEDGDGPKSDEWRTPPLWGVADSAPYLHDGRAATLQQAIEQHGGQGKKSAQKFQRLPKQEREELITFLQTMRAPHVATVQLASNPK